MYCTKNFKTKKAMKEAVERGDEVHVYQPGPFEPPDHGIVEIEGPHYPAPHTWYAQVFIMDGVIKKVLK
jgi:hypothetical protein